MKKSICIILSILMLCTTFTVLNLTVMANELNTKQANSDELVVYGNGNIIGNDPELDNSILSSGSFGDDLQWSLTVIGLLTISGNGAMPDFEYSAPAPWNNYSFSIKEVVIENGVTTIGTDAFNYCVNLTSATIPNSVTTIGASAFNNCSALKSITIPKSVIEIGTWAFGWCSALSNIAVEEGNPVFDSRDNCNAIIKTATNSLVQGCKSTIIPNSVSDIAEWAFHSCRGLTSITIPNGVTNISSSAFSGCIDLTNITLPNTLTSIGSTAFGDCTSLTSITIPKSVTKISGSILTFCVNLSSIKVEEGNKVYDSRNNCNAIIETSTNSLIQGCKSTVIPNDIKSIGWDAFSGFNELTNITIPDGVTSIGGSAFRACRGITSITIPDGVTKIEPFTFSDCGGLTNITLPNSIKHIAMEAFSQCRSLTDVYYQGTEEQWKAITFDNPNCFGDATIHFVGESSNLNSIGDVNLDGKINILDVTAIQKHLAQIITLENNALALADTNADDKINILDATQIQKYLAHIIPEL